MSDQLFGALSISAGGMKAQSTRLRVISENIANADTAASRPGETPYTRQRITFKNILDREMDAQKVQVDRIDKDTRKPYPVKFMPDHPGADENGYVKMPNVDPLIEMMDMRESQRSYEANMGMVDVSKSMAMGAIDLLRR